MNASIESQVICLDDKYRLDCPTTLINGRQALIRLPLAQRELDRRHGLKTAGLISGYRGSPLGNYDLELWRAGALLQANDILFQPGLNEDLALTALSGSQLLDLIPGRTVDGVFALWYGKGPGVDRSGDAIKHANLQGVAPNGGVLLVFGDDHAGKSSTTAHQSDLTLGSWEVPVLYPSSVAEVLQLGLASLFCLICRCRKAACMRVGNHSPCSSEIFDSSGTSCPVPRHLHEPTAWTGSLSAASRDAW
jgi:indolepyruvate ferredoxin oxidoreductase